MWDDRYSAKHYIYGTEPNKFLKDNFNIIPKGNVLCLAEGEGRNAVFLAKQGYNVTAVDASLVGLKKAEKLAKDNNVAINFIHADLDDYKIGTHKWEGIVSIFCHVPKVLREKLHNKVMAGLKKNGVLLLEAYTPEQINRDTGGPGAEDLMMSKELLVQELVGLKFTHLEELDREINEGSHHCGIGSVVQAIGSTI